MSSTIITTSTGDVKVFTLQLDTFEDIANGILFTDDDITIAGTYLSQKFPESTGDSERNDYYLGTQTTQFFYSTRNFIQQIVPPYSRYITPFTTFSNPDGTILNGDIGFYSTGYSVPSNTEADDIANTTYPVCFVENSTRTQFGFAQVVTWGSNINKFILLCAISYDVLRESWGDVFDDNFNFDGSSDPYDPSGTSDTGGGTGDLDGTSDSIDIPSLPTLTAVDSGFISLFNPTLAQLKSLSSYMWGSLFDLDNFKKLFNDPMECILGLSIVPVNVPSGSAETITVGNLITAVTMNKATTQYVSVDCGSLNVNEYWGAYLDYAPHTKAQIYLPYCGTHDIDVDDIMNKTVHVVYHIDILTGGCVAYVKCGSSVLYEFSGNCATQIPVTNNDFSNMMKSIIDVGVAVGGALATGGMTAPLTMANAVGSGAESLAGSSINGGMKPNVQKSGSMSSSIGLMGVQTPYIILTRPRQCVPGKQNEYTGYPSYITETLGSLSGYTEIHSIHLDGIPATDEELNEIDSLLSKGVIL